MKTVHAAPGGLADIWMAFQGPTVLSMIPGIPAEEVILRVLLPPMVVTLLSFPRSYQSRTNSYAHLLCNSNATTAQSSGIVIL